MKKRLKVRIGADMSAATRAFRDVKRQTQQFAQDLKRVGKTMSTYVTAPIVAMGALSMRAWDQQAQAIAKVENGLRSTGGAAGRTLKQLTDQASELQRNTLFGDEDILNNATAQLLTFTNIAGQQFDRTQRAALDLASKLDGDLKSASIQLGKALNDPVANLSALSRSGIQFSADQKAVIKSLAEGGRLAEAQTVILDELEKQYGGTAAAAAAAGAGGLKQLSNELGDSMEMIGELIYDFLRPLISAVRAANTWFQNLSKPVKEAVVIFGGLLAAVGPVLVALGGIVSIAPAIAAAWTLITGPIGLAVAAVAGLTAAGVYLYRNWDEVVVRVTKAASQVRAAIAEAMQGAVDAILSFAVATSTIPGLAGNIAAGTVGTLAGLSSQLGEVADEANAVARRMETALKIRRDLDKYYGRGGASGGGGANGAFPGTTPGGGGGGAGAGTPSGPGAASVLGQVALPQGSLQPTIDALNMVNTNVQAIRSSSLEMGEAFRTQVAIANAAVNNLAGGIGDAALELVNFKDPIGGIIDGFKKMGSSIVDTMKQVVRAIVAAIAKALILKALTLATGGTGSFLGNIVAGLGGGRVAAPTRGGARQQQATLTARTTMSGAVLLEVIVDEVARRQRAGREVPFVMAT